MSSAILLNYINILMCGGTLKFERYLEDSFEIKHIHSINNGFLIKTEYFRLTDKRKHIVYSIISSVDFGWYIEDMVYNKGYKNIK